MLAWVSPTREAHLRSCLEASAMLGFWNQWAQEAEYTGCRCVRLHRVRQRLPMTVMSLSWQRQAKAKEGNMLAYRQIATDRGADDGTSLAVDRKMLMPI